MAVGDTYAKVVNPGPRTNALSTFLGLKKVFDDAQRQNQVDAIREQRKQYAQSKQDAYSRETSFKQAGINQGSYTPTPSDMSPGGWYDQGTTQSPSAMATDGATSAGQQGAIPGWDTSNSTKSIALQDAKNKQQDSLEEKYATRLDKILSNRSGGLGVQDAKVNQAVHLRTLLDQYYDPNTKTYKVPQSQYEELAIGLANLLSGTNVATNSMREGIMQKTAKGDFAGAVAYITGTTPSASTGDVFKNLSDSIDRQGAISEKLRDKYLADLRKQFPSSLDKSRIERLEKTMVGNSYNEVLSQSSSKSSGKSSNKTSSGIGYTIEP